VVHEGYSSGPSPPPWRGSLYLHGEADDGRPELLATLSALVGEVCGRAPGEAVLPAFLEPLPVEGLVPQSERWVAADLLGHAFLPGGVTAAYRLDEHEARLFYSDLGGEEAAEQALEKLRATGVGRRRSKSFLRPAAAVSPTRILPSDPAARWRTALRCRRALRPPRRPRRGPAPPPRGAGRQSRGALSRCSSGQRRTGR